MIVGAQAQSFDYSTIAPHPRLFINEGSDEKILDVINNNSSFARVDGEILDYCDSVLDEAPVERIKEGKRLLGKSRIALKRIFHLSYAYRIHGGDKYADRAIEEMLAVSKFSDWNPTHFLDVGEMAMGLAIGYDWLFDYISEADKATIREAIIRLGFDAAKNKKNAWFYDRDINWNSVCNGGLLAGALAIFEDAKEPSLEIIEKCMETNPKAMNSYGPDGGYPEGYGYWGYGTSYQVMILAMLDSAFGTDNGLSSAPGFLESSRFIQFMTSPAGKPYNFYDAGGREQCNPIMFWFASKLNDPSVLWIEKQYVEEGGYDYAEDRLLPLLMVFSSMVDLDKVTAPTSNFWYNDGHTPLFIYRGSWVDKTAPYLGVIGGSASSSHAHMDAGAFLYEKDGVRWAMDLGMQEYITLESKGVDLWNSTQYAQRWDVFRLSNAAHNTLLVNNESMRVDAHATIPKVFKRKNKKGAVVDLNATFAHGLKSTMREVTLDRKNNLKVVDKIVGGDAPANVKWIMCTATETKEVGPNKIEMEQDGKKMLLEIECPYPFELKRWSNDSPNSFDARNPGTHRIGFETNIPAGDKCQLVVKLTSIE